MASSYVALSFYSSPTTKSPYGMGSYKTEQLGIDHSEFTDPLTYNTSDNI